MTHACAWHSQGLAFSAATNHLYIADAANHRIKQVGVSADGAELQNSSVVIAGGIAGFGNGVGTSASFRSPRGIDISPDGTALYVADFGNHVVRSQQLEASSQ